MGKITNTITTLVPKTLFMDVKRVTINDYLKGNTSEYSVMLSKIKIIDVAGYRDCILQVRGLKRIWSSSKQRKDSGIRNTIQASKNLQQIHICTDAKQWDCSIQLWYLKKKTFQENTQNDQNT
jgi:hypothetical protein